MFAGSVPSELKSMGKLVKPENDKITICDFLVRTPQIVVKKKMPLTPT